METLIIFALFIGVMWLLLIRPQRKKQKEHAEMLESLTRGDDVITIGGMHGRVDAITEKFVDLEVTDDLILRFQPQAISERVDHSAEQAETTGP